MQNIFGLTSKEYRDRYVISVIELARLYCQGKLHIKDEDINRVLSKWNSAQRSEIIEAILRKMPMASITLHQNEDMSWDIIDGFKRIISIFQFIGILKDENNNIVEPYNLNSLQVLSKLDNYKFNSKSEDDLTLNEEQKKLILSCMIQTDIIKPFGVELIPCQILKRCIYV